MSSSVAAVNVVRPYDRADELLRDVIQLVGRLGAAEHAEVARIVLRYRLSKSLGHAIECLFPAHRLVGAVLPEKRLRKTVPEWDGHK